MKFAPTSSILLAALTLVGIAAVPASAITDSTPPVVDLAPAPTYSIATNSEFTWSAIDADSAVESYDVETAIDGAQWGTLLSGTTATTFDVFGSEGEVVHFRVRARDTLGNVSDWSETQTTIDRVEPTVTFGEPSTPGHGLLVVPVSVSNIGAPIVSSTYAFNDNVGGMRGALNPTVTYRNLGNASTRPELTVFATDAAGRTVKESRTYTAPPRWLPLRLRITKFTTSGATLKVTGTAAQGFTGYVTVAAERRGRTGTPTAKKRVRATAGLFTTALRLRPGIYRVTAQTKTGGDFLGSATSKSVKFR